MVVKMNITITILLIIAIFLAEISQKNKTYNREGKSVYRKYENFYMLPFVLSFCILAGVCFFCKSGTDMSVYIKFYSAWTVSDFSDWKFEIGDKILFIILHRFIKNPYVGIGLVKILSIALVYRAIYLVRDKIKIGLAVIAYIVLLYIFNFHLIRMMIAIGLVFLALSYEITGKRAKCMVLLITALFFHYSSCLVLLTYFSYLACSKRFSMGKILVILMILTFSYSNAIQIVDGLTQVRFFSKYTTYETVTASGSGILQIVLFIPIAIILFKGYRTEKETAFYQLAFFCGIMTFFTGSLGYVYTVTGRLRYYFYFFFVIYGAATPLKMNDIVLRCGKRKINLSTGLIYVWLILNTYIYFIVGNAFVSNGVRQYIPIFTLS